jgi:hypothetical protein
MSFHAVASVPNSFSKNYVAPAVSFWMKNLDTNGAVNVGNYADESTNAYTFSQVGTATNSTSAFSPWSAPIGHWACQLNNISGESLNPYITGAASLAYTSGQDLTWEAFVMRTHVNTYNTIASLSSSGQVVARITGTGMGTQFAAGTTGPAADTMLRPGTWHHIALVRIGGISYTYFDGLLIASAANTDARNFSGASAVLGNYNANGGQEWLGYISNMRITIGEGLYTDEFVPPTSPLTAGPNTKCLMFVGPTFNDYSGNNQTLTTGTAWPRMVPISPFASAASSTWSGASTAGSYYNSGTANNFVQGPTVASANGFGTGDFTVEAWVYMGIGQTNNGTICGAWSGTSATSSWLMTQGSTAANGGLRFAMSNGSTNTIIESTTGGLLRPGNWVHCVVARSSGTLLMFLNGTQVHSVANTTAIAASSTPITIGTISTGANASSSMNITGVKVTPGTALYTAAFTPPTAPPTPSSGTTNLLNFRTASIYDDCANATLIPVGDTKVSTAQAPYGTTSIAFDGTGDYMVVHNTQACWYFGAQADFTAELYVYINNAAGTNFFIVDSRNANQQTSWNITRNASNKLVWNFGATARATSTTNLVAGQWYHVAYSRLAGRGYLFINGNLETAGGVADTDTYSVTTANAHTATIGGAYNGAALLNGYIKGLRLSRWGRYRENFTPPTDL